MRYLSRHGWLIGLALLYTLLNAPKPLTVDDGAYYYFARQVAHDPARPYDFTMFWYQYPHPANEILAPPVLPYWWGLGMTILGDEPWRWKLWLFPFALGFVVSVYALARRFAHGIERHLVCLTVLSPLFLPSLNLMLDVPALALGLGALAVLDRACARRSIPLTLLAGLLAGLAMQTKYTMFVIPVAMVLYAMLVCRPWRGFLAAALAGGIFVGWEYLIFKQHGQSHFLANLPNLDRETWIIYKLFVSKALLPMLGGTMPALPLLGLAALGCSRWVVAGFGGLTALGYVAIVCFQKEAWLVPGTSFWFEHPLEQIILGTIGVLLFGVCLAAGWILLFGSPEEEEWEGQEPDDSSEAIQASPSMRNAEAGRSPIALLRRNLDWFLLLWFGMELGAYFALSPFPAARRVMSLAVVATLLLGRLAARTCLQPPQRKLLTGIVIGSTGLGLLFYAIDLIDASVQRIGPESAAAFIGEQPTDVDHPSPTIWYVGHWGFQFYAERAGMKPVVPDLSVLRPGDWLIMPDARWEQQLIQIEPDFTHAERQVVVPEIVPLRTVRCFYGGYVPLEHHTGPRMTVTIYRITADWQPRTPRDR